MPRLNNPITPGARKKMENLVLQQDTSLFTTDLFVFEAINPPGQLGSINGTTVEFQNTVNSIVRDAATTILQIPIAPSKQVSSTNGVIKCKIISDVDAPLESQIKGENTLSWLENVDNLKIEVLGDLSNEPVKYLAFEDPRENYTLIDGGQKATSTKIFYISKRERVVDHLSVNKNIIGWRLDLTSTVSSLVQDDEGSLLEIQYLIEPNKPKNAKYIKITVDSMCLWNAMSTRTGSIINTQTEINEINATDIEIQKGLSGDMWYIDGVWPKKVVNQQALFSSWMSGEIHNKFRIWDEIYTSYGKSGHFDWIGTKRSNNNATANDGGYLEINWAQGWWWSEVIPNRNYFIAGPTGLSPEWANDVKNIFNFNIEVEGVKSWYNDFSFFENLYSEKNESTGVGNPKWKTTNSFFTFDVQKCQVIGVPQWASEFGDTLLEEGLIVSNPENIKNPNLSTEVYNNLLINSTNGNVTINGTTFSAWDNPIEKITKDDKLYNWSNTEENRKYIVNVPKLEYIERYKKQLASGGQSSSDNNVNIRIGTIQTTSKRQPFPTGDGSIDIHYPNEIFYSKQYCQNNNWPTDNVKVIKLEDEKTLDRIDLNIWGGEKIKFEFFDSNYEPAVGEDADGNETALPPTIVRAPNKDQSNNPLKSSISIYFGFASANI